MTYWRIKRQHAQDIRRVAHHLSHPVAAQAREDGAPLAFTWRGVMHRVRVSGRWRLSTRWWEPAAAAERPSFRVITSDQHIFELYDEAASTVRIPDNKRWVLDICQD